MITGCVWLVQWNGSFHDERLTKVASVSSFLVLTQATYVPLPLPSHLSKQCRQEIKENATKIVRWLMSDIVLQSTLLDLVALYVFLMKVESQSLVDLSKGRRHSPSLMLKIELQFIKAIWQLQYDSFYLKLHASQIQVK